MSECNEACAQMADPERYERLRTLTYDQRHPCPVEDCRLSAEEHHRLAFGVLSELNALRRRVKELEQGGDEASDEAPSPLTAFVIDVLGRLEALEAAQEAHNRPLSAEQGQNEVVHVHDDERPANG